MTKKQNRILAILATLVLLFASAAPALAVPQGDYAVLAVHTTANGAPIDGATYEILNYNGVIMTFTKDGNGEYAHGGSTSEIPTSGGSFILYGLPEGSYTVRQKSVPTGYDMSDPQSKSVYQQIFNTSNCYFSISQIAAPTPDPGNPPAATKGSIRIVNTDAQTGAGLQDATFALFDERGGKLKELTTGFLGEILVPELAAGRYAVVQVKAANGYVIDPAKYTANVEDGKESIIEIKNKGLLGSLKVTLTDTAKKPLQGGSFGVYKADGAKLSDISSDGSGEAYLSNMEKGDYYVMQSKAPEGYTIDTAKHSFSIAGNSAATVEIVNAPVLGRLEAIVTDKNSGAPIQNVVLSVYNANNDRVGEIVSGHDGYAYSANLGYGEYHLTVLKAPEAYAVDYTRYNFTIGKDKATVNVKLDVAQGKVRIIKEDYRGKVVSGSAFDVCDAEGKTVATLTTGSEGMETSENLPCGKYTLKETKNAGGEKLSTQTHEFTILANQTVDVRIVGDAKTGTLEVLFKHVDDNREIAKKRTYTDVVGSDYMQWVNENGLDKRDISGYAFVKAEYPAESSLIDGIITITYWYHSGSNVSGTVSGSAGSGSSSSGSSAIDELPEEGDYYYNDLPSVPQTGDADANIPVALGSLGTVLGAGIFFIKKKMLSA